MRFLAISLLLLVPLPAVAQDKTKAQALLQLAAQQRQQECPFCKVGLDCNQELARGRALAHLEKKQLVIWVGGRDKKVASQLGDCIQVEVSCHNNSRMKRVVLPLADGDYYWSPEKMTVEKLKANFPNHRPVQAPTPPVYYHQPVYFQPVYQGVAYCPPGRA